MGTVNKQFTLFRGSRTVSWKSTLSKSNQNRESREGREVIVVEFTSPQGRNSDQVHFAGLFTVFLTSFVHDCGTFGRGKKASSGPESALEHPRNRFINIL